MIERIARAIFFRMNSVMHDHEKLWRECLQQNVYRDCARAAVEAIREPTEKMKFGGHVALENITNGVENRAVTPIVWKAMIDASLTGE
jgi:hypothetical protein